MQRLPEITRYEKLSEFVKESLNFIKNNVSADAFKEKVRALGFTSRVTYQQIIRGHRQFSSQRIGFLVKTMDLSFLETQRAHQIAQGDSVGPSFSQQPYVLGPAEILSNPLNTIVLNLCGLSKKMSLLEICKCSEKIFTAKEVIEAVELLLKHGMLRADSDGSLRRVEHTYQLSSPQGVKTDYAKKYIHESLKLAEKNYDLPLSEREYASFTARINQQDFDKVKDLVRLFRKTIYELSDHGSRDTVVQVNLNAIIVSSPSRNSSEQSARQP